MPPSLPAAWQKVEQVFPRTLPGRIPGQVPHPGVHLHSVEWAGAAGTEGSDAMWELLAGAREKFDRMRESTDHRFFVDNAEKTAVDIVDEIAGCIHVSLHVAPSPPPLLVQQSQSCGKKECGQLQASVAFSSGVSPKSLC